MTGNDLIFSFGKKRLVDRAWMGCIFREDCSSESVMNEQLTDYVRDSTD
jgi:hypothetical protein